MKPLIALIIETVEKVMIVLQTLSAEIILTSMTKQKVVISRTKRRDLL